MSDNPYEIIMKEAMALHDKKKHDYSKDDDRFSNFTITAELVKHFKNPIDQVFVTMIGIKLSRLAELRNGKEPNNESIHDSHVDLINYCALWGSYYLMRNIKLSDTPITHDIPKEFKCSICGQINNTIQEADKHFMIHSYNHNDF